MRERKNNITLDVDSALALMQEIYNDVVENRNTASIIMKKMMSFMKDAEDCTEKKISLVKLQGALLKQTQGTGNGKGGPMGKLSLSDEDLDLIDKLVKHDQDKKSDNYIL